MKRMGLAMLGLSALLAGCGEESRGGLSAEEERQLDNAAKMLDDNMIDVSPDSLVANEAEVEAVEVNDTGIGQSPPGNAQ